jgi:hypothetical protein
VPVPKASPLDAQRKQFRQKANARSWAEAEQLKLNIEDQLSGREVKQDAEAHGLPGAIETFLKDKPASRK